MAKVAENSNLYVSIPRSNPVDNGLADQLRNNPPRIETQNAFRQGLQNVLARKRMGSLILYTMGALALAILCSVVFSLMGQDTQFAISIMGSLIGGFLGALLAAALIVDIYSSSGEIDHKREGKKWQR